MQFTTGGYLLWAVIMIIITVAMLYALRTYYDAQDRAAGK